MSFFSRLFPERVEKPIATSVAIGDTVKIIDGAFTDYIGEVLSIDDATKKVKVVVSMFGTDTTLEVRLAQVALQ